MKGALFFAVLSIVSGACAVGEMPLHHSFWVGYDGITSIYNAMLAVYLFASRTPTTTQGANP